MDTLEPTPTTVLLSAEQAKAQLREIVESFFFRRRPSDHKRCFLTKKRGRGNPALPVQQESLARTEI